MRFLTTPSFKSSGISSPRNVGVAPVTHVFGPPNCTLVSVSLPPTSLTAGRPRTADVIISYHSRFTLPRNLLHFTYTNTASCVLRTCSGLWQGPQLERLRFAPPSYASPNTHWVSPQSFVPRHAHGAAPPLPRRRRQRPWDSRPSRWRTRCRRSPRR